MLHRGLSFHHCSPPELWEPFLVGNKSERHFGEEFNLFARTIIHNNLIWCITFSNKFLMIFLSYITRSGTFWSKLKLSSTAARNAGFLHLPNCYLVELNGITHAGFRKPHGLPNVIYWTALALFDSYTLPYDAAAHSWLHRVLWINSNSRRYAI